MRLGHSGAAREIRSLSTRAPTRDRLSRGKLAVLVADASLMGQRVYYSPWEKKYREMEFRPLGNESSPFGRIEFIYI